MPAGYGLGPEGEGLLAWGDVEQRLSAARNYWVATTRPDGRPHVMPVWGLWIDGAFHFSTDPRSRKGMNLAANPNAVVHLESGDDVVVVEGTVAPVMDGDFLGRFVEAYDAKYGFRPDPADPGGAFYRLHARVALAWREQDFPTSASRWLFAGS